MDAQIDNQIVDERGRVALDPVAADYFAGETGSFSTTTVRPSETHPVIPFNSSTCCHPSFD
jgi:hypothetical protein